MASYTTNLNLKKPAGSENVAIGDINNNMDTIDQAFGTLNSKFTVDESVYTITDSTNGYIPTTISPATHLIVSAFSNANDKAVRYFKKSDYFNLQVYDAGSGSVMTSGDIRIILGIMKR